MQGMREEQHQSYEEKQRIIMLKVVMWCQGYIRTSKARFKMIRRQWEARHCEMYSH